MLKTVRIGQIRDDYFTWDHGHTGDGALCVAQYVRMGQFDAFRVTGCAAGIAEDVDIIL